MKVDLMIIKAKELVTVSGASRPRTGSEMDEINVIPDGAIAIVEDRIIDLGPTAEIVQKYPHPHKLINAENKVVMPGFVDPHTHPVFKETRENEFEMRLKGKSYVEISTSGGGIRSSIQGVRETSADRLFQLAVKRIKKMILNGTTTLEAKSGYGLSTESEIKMLKIIRRLNEELPIDIVATFLGAHEFPVEYKDDKNGYINLLINEMLPEIKKLNLAEYCDIFTEEHVFTIEQSRRILKRAKELGYKIRMHADEIQPIGGASLAGEIRAVSADHLGATSDKGITALKENGIIGTLLPATIFSLGLNTYARARDMITAGVPIALATDFNPGSSNCDSMQFINTLACLKMRMTPAEAITASTINAAYSLDRGDEVGSLEIGKKADIIVLDMPSYQYLSYHIGSSSVETVIKNGKIIKKNKPSENYPEGLPK